MSTGQNQENSIQPTKKSWDGVDRREGPDWLSKLVNICNVSSWGIFVVSLAIFHYARPELNNIILEFHNIPIREHWVQQYKSYLYVTLYVSVFLSALTIVVNQLRSKRKTDHQRYNVVFLLVVVVAFIAVISL